MISLETREIRNKLAIISSEANELELRLDIHTPADDARMVEAISAVSALPIYTITTRGGKIGEIRENVRNVAAEKSLRLVVIDSLQHVTNDSAKRPAGAFDEIISELKAMANELRLPVLVVSQLNDILEDCSDPRLSMLPIDVANYADLVMFLHEETGFRGYEERKRRLQIVVAPAVCHMANTIRRSRQ